MEQEIVDRIMLVFKRFDAEDKEGIARQLVEVLELEPSEGLIQKTQDALSRDLSEEERFKLHVLERIIKDRQYFGGGGFPDDMDAPWDDMGAPKSGR